MIKINNPKQKKKLDFRKIFCKDGILLNNADNESLYIQGRKEKEEKLRKNYYKYVNYYDTVRIDFLKNPHETLLDIINFYKKVKKLDEEDLCYLNQLKDIYIKLRDEIRKLKKENDLDLASIIKEFPPSDRMHDFERDGLDKRDNIDYSSKLKKIKDFYKNKEYNKKDVKEKFEYFKIFCEIYQISYIKSNYTKREYLSILNEVQSIRKEFADKGFKFANLYERKILDPDSVNINL